MSNHALAYIGLAYCMLGGAFGIYMMIRSKDWDK